MKIDPRIPANGELANETGKVGSSGGTGRPAAADAGRAASDGDSVEVSSQLGEIARLNAQAGSVPEIRTDKVVPLQVSVQNGTYRPDSGKVADAILAQQPVLSATAA